MKLIWHIVKKDLQHLRWLLVAWLVVIGLQVGLGVWVMDGGEELFRFRDQFSVANEILIGLQLIMAMFFVAELVQQDSLIELNAHWITLPISGAHLMAAKLTGLVLILWLLPAVVLWPWWLLNHWGAIHVLQGSLVIIAAHAFVTIPALLVGVMTSNWTRFLTWMIVFAMTLFVFGLTLLFTHQAIPFEIRPPDTLPVSRAMVGLGIIFALVAVAVANQYLTRNRPRTTVFVGVAIGLVVLALNFWPMDFAGRMLDALKPALPPTTARVQLHVDSISGIDRLNANIPTQLDLNAEGSFTGLEPNEYVIGRLVSAEWKWSDGVAWKWPDKHTQKSGGYSGGYPFFFSVVRDPFARSHAMELFPKSDALLSLGRPIIPFSAAKRLTEPTEFRARVEMAVRRYEVWAEISPQVGARFGRGADRLAIVEATRSETTLKVVWVETLPIVPDDLRERALQEFPYMPMPTVVFFNRAEREIPKTLGRLSLSNQRWDSVLGPFGGIWVSWAVFQVTPPREIYPSKPGNERYGPVDPRWFDETKLIWTRSRAVSRFEADIVEPHFVTHDQKREPTSSIVR